MDRRTVLSLLPSAALGAKWLQAQGADVASGTRDRVLSTLQMARYTGLYRRPDGSTIGIQRFVTDDGKPVLFFSDHREGEVRTLFPTGPDRFSLVRGFDPKAASEQDVTFDIGASGAVRSVRFRPTGGAPIVACAKVATRDLPVTFEQGDARLDGTLILPPGEGPFPAIVLLHGSGPLTRFSFGPYPRFFSSLGLAVLIFDKRGTGASTGRRLDASSVGSRELMPAFYPDDLINDARAAIRQLVARPDIDEHRIGCWGSSEGGMLSTQIAAQEGRLAFAINSSGFMGPLWETFVYQWAERVKRSDNARDYDRAKAWYAYCMEVARTGHGWEDYVRRRDELIRNGKRWVYNGIDHPSLEQMRWAWDHIWRFDALPALSRVKCPVLGLWGQEDPLTDASIAPAAMARALRESGNDQVTTRVFANAGHSLMEQSEAARLAPGVLGTLRDWIGAHLTPPPSR